MRNKTNRIRKHQLVLLHTHPLSELKGPSHANQSCTSDNSSSSVGPCNLQGPPPVPPQTLQRCAETIRLSKGKCLEVRTVRLQKERVRDACHVRSTEYKITVVWRGLLGRNGATQFPTLSRPYVTEGYSKITRN